MLQYRAAAIAGFATQCWWGGIKVMIYAAFYHNSAVAAQTSISLAQVITYTWLAQGFLALTPWACDPEISLAVRSGGIALDCLRPVDTYALWYARAAGWMTSRALPRAFLMVLLAGVAFPLFGLDAWALQPPPTFAAAVFFPLSLVLAVALSAAITMLFNAVVTATAEPIAAEQLLRAVQHRMSGNLLPLPLMPDGLQRFLMFQPFAGVVDIPFRIYTGHLAGRMIVVGLALQLSWTVVLVVAGRRALTHVFARVEIQGG